MDWTLKLIELPNLIYSVAAFIFAMVAVALRPVVSDWIAKLFPMTVGHSHYGCWEIIIKLTAPLVIGLIVVIIISLLVLKELFILNGIIGIVLGYAMAMTIFVILTKMAARGVSKDFITDC